MQRWADIFRNDLHNYGQDLHNSLTGNENRNLLNRELTL
jgi:hypothetical protein